VPGTAARYLRVNITANSGWAAGQIAELEVYPSGGGSTPTGNLTASPTSLTFASQALNTTSAAQAVTVRNTGTGAAAISGVSVTGDFAQTSTCGTSLGAGASCTANVTFRPTASGTRTGTLTVGSLQVALSGTGAGGSTSTNLAAGKPTAESSHTDVYPSSNVTDGNQNTYWESANNAFPQWVQVDLGTAQSASRVVLTLPPTWGARTETLSVQGSTNGSTWTTVKASAGYTFNPSGNTVAITFAPTTQRYFRLTITGNTGWPAGQVSELQVWNS
jgi:F5/8 type C domain